MKSNLIFTLLVTSCIVLFINQVCCHENKDHKGKSEGSDKTKRSSHEMKTLTMQTEKPESDSSTTEAAEARRKRGTEDMKQNFEGGMKKMMDGLKDTITVFQGFLANKDKKERKKRGTEDMKQNFEGGMKKMMDGLKDTITVFQGFLGSKDKKERKKRETEDMISNLEGLLEGANDRIKRQNDMKDKIKGKVQEFIGKAKGFFGKGDKNNNGESGSSSGRKKRGIADVDTPDKIGEESAEGTKFKRQAEEGEENETKKGKGKGKGKGKKGGKVKKGKKDETTDASELSARKKRCISEQATSEQSTDQPSARKRRLVHLDARQAYQTTYTFV